MEPIDLVTTISALENLAQSVPDQLREDDALRKRLLDAVRKLVPEVETPMEAAQRLLYSPTELVAAKIGVDLGLFTALVNSDRPLRAEELGEKAGADPSMMLRLLKYMNSVGLAKEQGVDLWGPTNYTKNFALRSNEAGVNFGYTGVVPALLALPSWLKRKQYQTPSESVDGAFAQGHREHPDQTFYTWLAAHPELAGDFGLFVKSHQLGTKTWLDGMDFESTVYKSRALSIGSDENGPLFVDIGGGLGQQCEALKAKYPKMTGRIILQDLPNVIEKVTIDSAIEKMSHDMFEMQPIRGSAIYYIRSVLRNWSDEQCVKILSRTRDAMGYHSVVIIDDIVMPDKDASKESTQLDMGMLALLGAVARTERQWKKLLRESSLQLLKINPYQDTGGESVIVAQRIPIMA